MDVADGGVGPIESDVAGMDAARQIDVLEIEEVTLVEDAGLAQSIDAQKHEAALKIGDVERFPRRAVVDKIAADAAAQRFREEEAREQVEGGGEQAAGKLRLAVGEHHLRLQHPNFGVAVHVGCDGRKDARVEVNVGIQHQMIAGALVEGAAQRYVVP